MFRNLVYIRRINVYKKTYFMFYVSGICIYIYIKRSKLIHIYTDMERP